MGRSRACGPGFCRCAVRRCLHDHPAAPPARPARRPGRRPGAVGWLLGKQQSARAVTSASSPGPGRSWPTPAPTPRRPASRPPTRARAPPRRRQMVAHAQAQVAKAVAERDGAVARAQEIAADREAMLAQFKAAVQRDRRAPGQGRGHRHGAASAGHRAAARARGREPAEVRGTAHRGGEGARRDRPPTCAPTSARCAIPGRRCARRPRHW